MVDASATVTLTLERAQTLEWMRKEGLAEGIPDYLHQLAVAGGIMPLPVDVEQLLFNQPMLTFLQDSLSS